jgi:signal transduction histidine kinase
MGTLAAGVAHEINNPLAIINEAAGFLSLLLKKEELAAMPRRQDFEKAIQKISNAVKRARVITHQLLGSVRKQEPVFAEVDLYELATETLQLVHKEAANKEIRIIQSQGGNPGPIWIDPNQVRQILINLLTNAIHATGKDGKIEVRIEADPETSTLIVSDTGKGIPRENMEKIFEPFFSDKPPGEGTGLGLFVTRQIVEKLGGKIEVQSRVGVGTSMKIILPNRNPLKST